MEILLPRGGKKLLAEDFNVSRITVWKALTGRLNSEKARRIRQAAFDLGGCIWQGERVLDKTEKTSVS